jgi:transcriptional regulator with XRE-family HTH domain
MRDRDIALIKLRGKRLRWLRNIANLSRQELENRYHVNTSTLKGWEIGRSGGLSEKGARKILKIFDRHGVLCSFEWLMYEIGIGPQIRERIKKFSVQNNIEGNDEKRLMVKGSNSFCQNNKKPMEFIVVDKGMEPYYFRGDYVGGIGYFGNNIKKTVGFNCIIQTQSGELFLRRIRKGSKQDCYDLVCTNLQADIEKPILYDIRLVSAAPVIWIRRKRAENLRVRNKSCLKEIENTNFA